MRTILIHYHLFKNAGSTIDSILERNFPGEAHGHLEGPLPWSTVSPQELLEYALANPAVRAISSHQARLPVPQHPGITFVPILFLRHPIDRVASVYEFERREPADSLSPSVAIAQNGGFAAFVNWVVGRETTAVCRNFQVAHLAHAQHDMREARATHDDYLQALAHLKNLPFFGIVESFEASIQLLRNALPPELNQLDLDFTIKNFSPGRKATLEARLEQIEKELGPSLYRELLEHNALDMLLYRQAQQLFAENCARHETGKIPASGQSSGWPRVKQWLKFELFK
ncbi:sulfotransferase family 2 domain-containing protein [Paraburkholderia hayleyella]|uniref:sulfotransferase family 2 domain-containing protein n=1 Tax=Paraburkholderia hayleyella TaxID=2152889 RepID=UPI0012924339|nr:sulfotransferase family 2 domain-containing protein [Paraburkholderia hayleyella]